MTRERTKELLPYWTAYAEGKTIQFLRADGAWEEAGGGPWDSGGQNIKFRVKPEPREFWVVQHPDIPRNTSMSLLEATRWMRHGDELIHCREVL